MDWPQLSDHVIDASYRGLGIIYCTACYLTYNLPLSKSKPTRSRSYSYFTCNPIKHQVKLMHDWPSDLLPIFGIKKIVNVYVYVALILAWAINTLRSKK